MLAVLFAFDKALALLRQVIIARQFGLSPELDAFNAANNLPDLLFALISGGALAVAFIPVLTSVLSEEGRSSSWLLFSRISNLAFLVTALFSIIFALLADRLVGWELGIAPGFTTEQQVVVIRLMRLNLIGTLVFSLSGLVMAGLQANQHFLLPALAPILYNTGQIFGAIVLAPSQGYRISGITLPAAGLGVDGLVYGVILGAGLHLLIQLPGLIKFKFRWTPSLALKDSAVQRVLALLGPRVLTMLLIQLIFIVRDNLASRLESGAVTALAYGWMIQQVPETLIGTAIGTAMLPTLAELVSRGEKEKFQKSIQNAVNVLIGITVPVAFILGIGLQPFFPAVFGFDEQGSQLLLWVTRGYLLGLTGHCLLEVAARAFYAQQNARIPLFAAVVNIFLYISVGSLLFKPLGAAGISLTDAIAFTSQAVFLLFMLASQEKIWFTRILNYLHVKVYRKTAVLQADPTRYNFPVLFAPGSVLLRSAFAGIIAALLTYGCMLICNRLGLHPVIAASISMFLGALAALPFVLREVKTLLRL